MDANALLNLWADNTLFSGFVWLVIAVVVLYLARTPARQAIRTVARVLTRQTRLIATGAGHRSETLRRRARLALLQLARENVERAMERQLDRLTAVMRHDMASFPHLHRQVSDQLARLDEDYRLTTEAPPTPPEWIKAIETLAHLPGRDDPTIGRILEDMRNTLDRACHESMSAYRVAGRRRHRVLRRMLPLWRRMGRTMDTLQRAMDRLHARSDRLDSQITRFERVLTARPSVVRRLAAALGVRATLSALALAAIGVAAVMSFHLVAEPLARIGAGPGTVFGFAFGDVLAAAVLLLLAMAGGLFLESAGVTHLFPEMHWIEDRPRRLVAVASGIVTVVLLALMAALAWAREVTSAGAALTEEVLLRGAAELPATPVEWVPGVTQALLAAGFGIAIAATLLPLENLLRQLRVLILGALALTVAAIGHLARFLSALFAGSGRLLLALYDTIVFIPLAIERLVAHRRAMAAAQPASAPPDVPGEGRPDQGNA